MAQDCDVAIVGGGPAGLSAALMLGRARRSVLLIDDGHERNLSVRESHGFLGHDGSSPSDLLETARAQLEPYTTIGRVCDRVDAIEGAIDRFRLQLRGGDVIAARRIVFATGVYDELPEIDGIDALWQKRIFVCPYCDGWEYRDRRIAILGNTRAALDLAQELWNWSHDLVVCSNRQMPVSEDVQTWQAAVGIDVVESRPVALREQDGKVIVDCDGAECVECDVVFVSAPLRQHSKLPELLGCELTERGTIKVDAENRTTVAGCFAAGDCITKHHQITFAVASGAQAAISINEEFYTSSARRLVKSAHS